MLVLLAFALFMAGSILVGMALRDQKLRKQRSEFGSVRETTLAEAKTGERICVEGRVSAISFTQSSPFEGMPANVWMRTILEELARGWIVVFDEARKGDFAIEDEDGTRVIVKGPVRLVGAPDEKSVNTDLFDDELPEAVKRTSESFAARCQKQILDREALYRMRVETLSDGDRVSVVGILSRDKDLAIFPDEVIVSKQLSTSLLSAPSQTATMSKWAAAILSAALGIVLLRMSQR